MQDKQGSLGNTKFLLGPVQMLFTQQPQKQQTPEQGWANKPDVVRTEINCSCKRRITKNDNAVSCVWFSVNIFQSTQVAGHMQLSPIIYVRVQS